MSTDTKSKYMVAWVDPDRGPVSEFADDLEGAEAICQRLEARGIGGFETYAPGAGCE